MKKIEPKILTRLKFQLQERGMNPKKAEELATKLLKKSGNLKADGTETIQGFQRGTMTPAQRERDRKQKYKQQRKTKIK